MKKVTRLVTNTEIDKSVQEIANKIHATCSEFFLRRAGDNANPAASVICALVAELTNVAVIGGMPLEELIDQVADEYEAREEAYEKQGVHGLVTP